MNNVHVRRAFAYAFNHSKYLEQAWWGEAICRETCDIYGLLPDYYCYSPDPPWTYDYNLAKMQEELELAMFTQGAETKSVWAWGGFHLKIYYNAGNDPRRVACELVKSAFDALNAANPGKNFAVDIEAPDWSTFLQYMEEFKMPLWIIGWLADFADADNWKRPYMHSYGDFSYYSNYSSWNGWDQTLGPRTGLSKDFLIDLAVKTPDGPDREDMYKDLDDIYILDVPNYPIVQPLGRRWCKYWVKGWYYNTLYPSQYYYKMSRKTHAGQT